MSWTESKTLLEYCKYTPCQEIFQAVCDELGRYYETKGFKYSRSRPKLTIENNKIKLEICFWSSRSNIIGDYVNLEIIPSFYSKQLKKESEFKGFLFGHTTLFTHKFKEDIKEIRVNQIFGDIVDRIDQYSHESKLIDNRNCNVYGLDENKFEKIIHFIDSKIISWIDKLQTESGIIEFLDNASPKRMWDLFSKSTNSQFMRYVQLNFPEFGIERHRIE
jgi:hypothetical protein